VFVSVFVCIFYKCVFICMYVFCQSYFLTAQIENILMFKKKSRFLCTEVSSGKERSILR